MQSRKAAHIVESSVIKSEGEPIDEENDRNESETQGTGLKDGLRDGGHCDGANRRNEALPSSSFLCCRKISDAEKTCYVSLTEGSSMTDVNIRRDKRMLNDARSKHPGPGS